MLLNSTQDGEDIPSGDRTANMLRLGRTSYPTIATDPEIVGVREPMKVQRKRQLVDRIHANSTKLKHFYGNEPQIDFYCIFRANMQRCPY